MATPRPATVARSAMPVMHKILAAVFLAAGLGAGAAAAMPPALASVNHCLRPGARIVAHHGQVSLLERGRNSNWTIHLFSCWNPTGREHLITSQDGATDFKVTHILFNGATAGSRTMRGCRRTEETR